MGLILEGGAHVVEDLPALQDVRLQDAPLNNRRPDVTVYRADTIDVTPTRPERVPLVIPTSLIRQRDVTATAMSSPASSS
jgi:hypothetical protein